MEYPRRVEILNAVKGVVLVDSVDDTDDTVCEAIKRHKPTYFANGGDRVSGNTPELLWGVGGTEKLQSSSDLVKKDSNFKMPPIRTRSSTSNR